LDVKRWHDMGLTGWLTAIVYGPILLLYAMDQMSAGNNLMMPAALDSALLSVFGLVSGVYLILLAARKGNASTNRFGPVPAPIR
jgi:uncharacterized membrane protein YhaH (DUF805 family)